MYKILVVFLLFYTGLSVAGDKKAMRSEEIMLGELIFKDKNLSLNRNQSCETCHSLSPVAKPGLPAVPGFVDPDNVTAGSPVSKGSDIDPETNLPFNGTLNTPSVGYAAFSPKFKWDKSLNTYSGGFFWNGRAGDLAAQAKEPFLNPVEMAMPNAADVVNRLSENATYRKLFRKIYGISLPLKKQSDRMVEKVFQSMAQAVAAFERDRSFSKFNSKFDYVLTRTTSFTPVEQLGFDLFKDPQKGNCAVCHPVESTFDKKGNITVPPLFTNFGYENIGAPRNMKIPGSPEPDLGLGGRADIQKRDKSGLQIGKHKVMSLRNVAVTAPYGHNGVFASLAMIVHFYNTRDALPHDCDNTSPRFPSQCWPLPEVGRNVSNEFGNLNLTAEERTALIAFMNTLTDDYPAWGNDPLVPPGTLSPYPHLGIPSR